MWAAPAVQVSPPLAAFAVVAMGVLWSIMGGALLLATDTMEDPTAKYALVACNTVPCSPCNHSMSYDDHCLLPITALSDCQVALITSSVPC